MNKPDAINTDSLTPAGEHTPGTYRVIKRDGKAAPFDDAKIRNAIHAAFMDVFPAETTKSQSVQEKIARYTKLVCEALMRNLPGGGSVHIEDIQDQVELILMREGGVQGLT